MLNIGIKGNATEIVNEKNTAKAMGSGELEVYATPAMTALMEKAAYKSISAELEAGNGSVGTLLSIEHISATPVGMEVKAESELIKIEGRKLTFTVSAYDESGLIGKGTHERFIIDNSRFMEKTNNKNISQAKNN